MSDLFLYTSRCIYRMQASRSVSSIICPFQASCNQGSVQRAKCLRPSPQQKFSPRVLPVNGHGGWLHVSLLSFNHLTSLDISRRSTSVSIIRSCLFCPQNHRCRLSLDVASRHSQLMSWTGSYDGGDSSRLTDAIHPSLPSSYKETIVDDRRTYIE